MLFKCKGAKEIWKKLGLKEVIKSALQIDRAGSAILEFLLANSTCRVSGLGALPIHEIIATAAWFIWWRRREIKYEGKAPPANRVALSIRAMVANSMKTKENKQGVPKIGWSCPPAGFVKLNTDAAVDLGARIASSGCVIRDSRGQFMGAFCGRIDGVIDVTTAEAQALRDGLRLAERVGCTRLYVESDCMEAIQALTDPLHNRIVGSAFLDECRMILAGFSSTRIAHCPRDANKAAHMVARSTQVLDSFVWLDDPPEFLIPQLVEDVTLFS
jgi:ribonuclease HI